MELYISVAFYVGLMGIIFRSINLVAPHPRITEHSIGQDALELIIVIAFFAWVAVLKYGS
jgi:hypothetical protein